MVFNENDDNYSFESKTAYMDMGMQNLDEGAHMPLYWFRNSQTREFVPLEDVENILDVHFT